MTSDEWITVSVTDKRKCGLKKSFRKDSEQFLESKNSSAVSRDRAGSRSIYEIFFTQQNTSICISWWSCAYYSFDKFFSLEKECQYDQRKTLCEQNQSVLLTQNHLDNAEILIMLISICVSVIFKTEVLHNMVYWDKRIWLILIWLRSIFRHMFISVLIMRIEVSFSIESCQLDWRTV